MKVLVDGCEQETFMVLYSIGFEFKIRLRARKGPGTCFWKVPVTFRARKTVLCLPFTFKIKFNNLENDAMKLLVNEAKLTGL